MADLTTNNATVELGDALHAGFNDAMARVKELGLDPKGTLVDSIPQDQWDSWNASNENPTVKDTVLTGFEDDGEEHPAAA